MYVHIVRDNTIKKTCMGGIHIKEFWVTGKCQAEEYHLISKKNYDRCVW